MRTENVREFEVSEVFVPFPPIHHLGSWLISECYSLPVMFVRLMTQHTSRLVKSENLEEIDFLMNFSHF